MNNEWMKKDHVLKNEIKHTYTKRDESKVKRREESKKIDNEKCR